MDKIKMGELLKKLRISKNLNQEDIAKKFNVSIKAVSKWEKGESVPDIEILESISIYYNLSIEEIINGRIKDAENNNIAAMDSTVDEEIEVEATENSSVEEPIVEDTKEASLNQMSKQNSMYLPGIIFYACMLVLFFIACAIPSVFVSIRDSNRRDYYLAYNVYQTMGFSWHGIISIFSFICVVLAMIAGELSQIFKNVKWINYVKLGLIIAATALASIVNGYNLNLKYTYLDMNIYTFGNASYAYYSYILDISMINIFVSIALCVEIIWYKLSNNSNILRVLAACSMLLSFFITINAKYNNCVDTIVYIAIVGLLFIIYSLADKHVKNRLVSIVLYFVFLGVAVVFSISASLSYTVDFNEFPLLYGAVIFDVIMASCFKRNVLTKKDSE